MNETTTRDADPTNRAKIATIIQAVRDWQHERITWAECLRRCDVTRCGELCLEGIGRTTRYGEIEDRARVAAI